MVHAHRGVPRERFPTHLWTYGWSLSEALSAVGENRPLPARETSTLRRLVDTARERVTLLEPTAPSRPTLGRQSPESLATLRAYEGSRGVARPSGPLDTRYDTLVDPGYRAFLETLATGVSALERGEPVAPEAIEALERVHDAVLAYVDHSLERL